MFSCLRWCRTLLSMLLLLLSILFCCCYWSAMQRQTNSYDVVIVVVIFVFILVFSFALLLLSGYATTDSYMDKRPCRTTCRLRWSSYRQWLVTRDTFRREPNMDSRSDDETCVIVEGITTIFWSDTLVMLATRPEQKAFSGPTWQRKSVSVDRSGGGVFVSCCISDYIWVLWEWPVRIVRVLYSNDIKRLAYR
jgi:hypothetical protein